MPPFEYRQFVNPFLGDIGSMILHAGDVAAANAERVGAIQARGVEQAGAAQAGAQQQTANAWSGALRSIGSTAAAVPEQMQQAQMEAARQANVQQETQRTAMANAATQHQQGAQQQIANIMAASADPSQQPQGPDRSTPNGVVPQIPDFMRQDENGVSVFDEEGITKFMAAKGYGDQAPTFMKDISGYNDRMRSAASERTAAVQSAADLIVKSGYNPVLSDRFMKSLEANHFVPPDAIAQVRASIGTPAFKQFVDAVATPPKIGEAAPGSAGRFLTGPNAGQVVPNSVVPEKAPPPEFKPPEGTTVSTPTGLPASFDVRTGKWIDPTNGQPLGSDMTSASTKAPPPIEEQLLQAVAKGDTKAADNIVKTMKMKADASKDPAAIAQASALRALSMQEAQARLDTLKEKAQPIDISPEVQTTLVGGGLKYIDTSKYSASELAKVRTAAENAGIPAVNKETAHGLQAADRAAINLDTMWSSLKPMLPKDANGRLVGGANNTLERIFQTNPTLGAFSTWRTAAIQTVQALAEPGMGLRLNKNEVDSLIEGLPKITDDAPVAEQKMLNIRTQLEGKVKTALTSDRSSLGVHGGIIAPAVAPLKIGGFTVVVHP